MTPDTHTNPNTRQRWDELWPKVGVRFPEKEPVNQRKKAVAAMIPPHTTLLNVACGVSQIMHLLDPSVLHIGLDFSTKALHLFPGLRIQADVRALPIRTKSVHTVIAMEILEHLDDPLPFLRDLQRIARTQIIVTVPHNRLAPEKEPLHRRTYTRPTLQDLITRAIRYESLGFYFSPLNIIGRIML